MENKLLNLIGVVAVAISAITATFLLQEKKMNIGIDTKNMDTTALAGNDFYDYATGGWRAKNPIPNDYVRYGSFDVLANTNLERVRKIAESDNGKIGKLYDIAMDEKKLNAEKTSPVQKYIDEIDEIKSRDDIAKYLGRAHTYSSAFWGDGVGLDEMDSEHYLYNIGQSGTGLSRDYYFDTDEKSVEIRKKYREYIEKQMANFGINVDVEKLYKFEERMAKSFYTKEKLRDPHANYHKMPITQLRAEFPNFDWAAYFDARGINPEYINVNQPEAISESIAIINDTDLGLIKTYLKYRIVNTASGLLDDTTYDIAFDFYNRTMSGQTEKKPRWKRAVAMIDDSLGEEIGHLYVEKYFSAAAKERMQNLVKNLQSALGMRIENLEWMSNATKKQALEKLNTFKAKIGYPDKWRDYSKLEIKNDSLFENMMRVGAFEDRFWLDKIGQGKDPTIWYMNAHEVNAYYDPSTNEVCFPAGILQYPFFDMDADDAFNYGAIGSVIGHEMTHGFDDQGRQFDKDGNLRDWWTTGDAESFTTRSNVMRDFFNNILVAPDTHANGEFTLGENLADYGGVTVSYTAYKNFATPSETIDGLSPEQRFFIAYAMTEAGNIRDSEILRRTKTDPHSLSRWRVNGILPHIDAWYDAFDVKPENKMYIAPDKRVKIW
ncbi:MAG: M13 family metallopeptidase [Alphaproteobacteria bacterium]|nr:M13 family metallopeptidase [Alphaproteobacteria bacterium]